MANSAKVLARGAFTDSSASIYTVPNASTTTIITSIIICNTDSSPRSFTLLIDGVEAFNEATILAGATASFDLKQVIPANVTPKVIAGLASAAAVVTYHISGMEIA
jgi:hypothetical protein